MKPTEKQSSDYADKVPVGYFSKQNLLNLWVLSFKNARVVLLLIALVLLQACGVPVQTAATDAPTLPPSPTTTLTPELSATPAPTETITPTVVTAQATNPAEMLVLSIAENSYQHLFLYAPGSLPLTRITGGEWDDITPAFSPDGTRIAFASNRDGYFDLYILNLQDGSTTRLTDTREYDASPSWSPDGQWLAHETYLNDNLEIQITPASAGGQSIQLTDDPAADHSPAWSPLGRLIAYVSNRTGNDEVWLANLDSPDNRFTNISNAPDSRDTHPAWSYDGAYLAWASSGEFEPEIHFVEAANPEASVKVAGNGNLPAWTPTNKIITALNEPNKTYLTGFDTNGLLTLPLIPLPGEVRGLDTSSTILSTPLPGSLEQTADTYPTPVWVPIENGATDVPAGRVALLPLDGVQAPYPKLHDDVNEGFNALRKRLTAETGVDMLSSLENAYIPLTSPPEPGQGEDWLYTGRAFALNPVLANVSWLVVVPEQFRSKMYWHVYLRPQKQDGSMGEPLHSLPFDLFARYQLDPISYDAGGAWMSEIPAGYWVDFTSLAQKHGWERLPSLPNWQSYFKGIRFNQFVMTGGLDWRSAMLELYPPDVLVTPTPVPTVEP